MHAQDIIYQELYSFNLKFSFRKLVFEFQKSACVLLLPFVLLGFIQVGRWGNWWKTVGVSWYTVYWQQMFCNLCVGSYRMPQFHFVSNCTHCILTNSVSWNLTACFQNPRMRRLQPSCFRAIETTNVSVSQSLLVLTSPSVTMLVM